MKMVENGSNKYIIGVLVLLLFSLRLFSQTNLSGKPGLLYTPSALELKDGDFQFGYNYNPIHYGLIGAKKNPEQVWYARLTLLPRFEISISLLQMLNSKYRDVSQIQGIGDRSMDFRYLILRETPKRPSLTVIMTAPFIIHGPMLTHVLVATKNFTLTDSWKLETSIGYGSPYYIYRAVSNNSNSTFLKGFVLQKKSTNNFKNHYLEGPFGGVILHFRKKAGLMAEYDSKHLNVGGYVTFFKKWTLQAGLLNGDQVMFGTSLNTNLLQSLTFLKKK